MVVEDSPLLLDYGSISGDRCDVAKAQHLCSQVEAVLVAHTASSVPGGGEKCTINEPVTSTNIFGQDTADKGPAKQLVSGFTYPPGAANGEPKCVCPPTICRSAPGQQHAVGTEVFVGPNRLPAKLVEDITARAIREAITEGGDAVEVMKRVGSDLGHTVKASKQSSSMSGTSCS